MQRSRRDRSALPRLRRRGSSTKDDVTRLLGAPDGRGESLLPGQAGGLREVWVYQGLHMDSITDPKARAQSQVVVVFFDGDRFDGMMGWWTDDALTFRTGDASGGR